MTTRLEHRATLRLLDAEPASDAITLPSSAFTIGRHCSNDLPVKDPWVSRHHAEIIFDGATHVFYDKGSRGGSFINGERVEQQLLRHGDVIALGHLQGVRLVFEWSDQPAVGSRGSTVAGSGIVSVISAGKTRYLDLTGLDLEGAREDAVVSRLKALYEITSGILSTRSVVDLCQVLLDQVCGVLACERGWVLLTEDPSSALEPVAHKGNGSHGAVSGLPSRTVIDRVCRENVAILSVDAGVDERFAGHESIVAQSIRSVMCAPISSADRVWGVCYLDSRVEKGTFDGEQLEFLMAATRQAGMALENLHLVQEQKKALESFVRTLAASIDARDEMTAGHSARVAELAVAFAEYMGLGGDDVRLIRFAALLHDVGKIGTRDAVLRKPGELTPEELQHMKEHPRNTFRILSSIRLTRELADLPAIASAHHENIDGTGYPRGLKGEDIPRFGKIIALADVFDALTSNRHYRNPMAVGEALRTMEGMAGTKFDADLVATFQTFIEERRIARDETTGVEMEGAPESLAAGARVAADSGDHDVARSDHSPAAAFQAT